MRITLVHNPGAGSQAKDDARKLEKLLSRAGHEPRYVSSKDGDWKRALKKRADLVVVAGGDGTVGRVIRRMAGRDVPVAVLPSGTANNIARTFGLLDHQFDELVEGWEAARRVKLDLGVAKGPWGERYFIEGLGVGLFAAMLARPQRWSPYMPAAIQGSCQPRRRRDIPLKGQAFWPATRLGRRLAEGASAPRWVRLKDAVLQTGALGAHQPGALGVSWSMPGRGPREAAQLR